MRVTTQMFWLPKAGNTEEEYEDAFWPAGCVSSPLNGFRCAVADGATEASFSRSWAELLTRRWCEATDRTNFLESLPSIQEEWASQIEAVPMAWYAEEKARSGAYSSLLGLAFVGDTNEEGSHIGWQALAVGDSCLFRVRNDDLKAFPLGTSEEFNSRPFLLCSIPVGGTDLHDNIAIDSGYCALGDVFYLMTDALACWFLRRHEEGQDIAGNLLDLESPEMFQRIVEGQRAAKDNEGLPYLRNDDVTLYRLMIHE